MSTAVESVENGERVWRDPDSGQVVCTAPLETAAPEVVAAETIRAEVDTRLAPPSVDSIAEVKAAIRDGMSAAVDRLRSGA